MKIEKAEVTSPDGYPELQLTIDGHPASVYEPKLTLLDAGIVVLLDEAGYWEDTVGAEYGDPANWVAGAVKDEALVALVRRYLAGEEGDLLKEEN